MVSRTPSSSPPTTPSILTQPSLYTDLCYKLSFLIIMLNTLLHNPSVKEKTSIEDFITMSGDIDPDGELNRDLMIDVYNSIKKEPFKIPVDDGDDIMLTFFNPDREGWLSKQGSQRPLSLITHVYYYYYYTIPIYLSISLLLMIHHVHTHTLTHTHMYIMLSSHRQLVHFQ